MNRVVLAVLFLMNIACQQQKDAANEKIIAKVYDYELTENELLAHLSKTNTSVDSLEVVKLYIDQWVKQKLLFRNAQINLENGKELDQLVENYREELYVSYYKAALAKKKLDTMVTQTRIDSFYVKNKASFRLKEDLIKFRYIHVDRRNKNRFKIKQLFVDGSAASKTKILKEYNGYNDYYFNDSTWVSLEGVYSQHIDFPVFSEIELKFYPKFYEKRIDDAYFYIAIEKVLKRGEIAPKEYVKNTIKEILLHNNKLDYYSEMEQILIDDAKKQNQYEVY